MNILTAEQIRASDLVITEDELTVSLTDGRKISVPLAWFPKLLHATKTQRNQWRWIGNGHGIHWPLLDEDLSVAGFLQGTHGETPNTDVRVSGEAKKTNIGRFFNAARGKKFLVREEGPQVTFKTPSKKSVTKNRTKKMNIPVFNKEDATEIP